MRFGVRIGTGFVPMLLVAGTALAQGADAEWARPWWGWVLLGRLHPFVVHFPIGLILAGAAFECWQWLRRRPLPSDVGTFCLAAGLVAGAMAVWFGTLNADHQRITGESADILERHRYAGWAVLVAAATALLVGRASRVRSGQGRGGAYTALVGASALLVALTGHFGGQLVYGSTYVTSVLPWNRTDPPPATAAASPAVVVPEAVPDEPVSVGEANPPAPADPVGTSVAGAPAPVATAPPAPALPAAARTPEPGAPDPDPPASASAAPPAGTQAQPTPAPDVAAAVTPPAAQSAGRVDFARHVEPIFRTACVECHGPDKVKARLRMDSVAGLQAGGKNGALFVPGDPDASLLMRRVLGLDGEDQMPLDADPLPVEQMEVLRRWILQGARYDAPTSPDSQPQP